MSDTQRGHFRRPAVRPSPEAMGERGECARCHRTGLGLLIPRGGDGSMRKPRPHNDRDGKPCDGRYDAAVGWE